jgi:type IV pilus assembly protein PilB
LGFAETLRAALRQDPDDILIGRIRDEETASIEVKSSLTGHLVLSTLSSNGTVTTIQRLLNLGI